MEEGKLKVAYNEEQLQRSRFGVWGDRVHNEAIILPFSPITFKGYRWLFRSDKISLR